MDEDLLRLLDRLRRLEKVKRSCCLSFARGLKPDEDVSLLVSGAIHTA